MGQGSPWGPTGLQWRAPQESREVALSQSLKGENLNGQPVKDTHGHTHNRWLKEYIVTHSLFYPTNHQHTHALTHSLPPNYLPIHTIHIHTLTHFYV